MTDECNHPLRRSTDQPDGTQGWDATTPVDRVQLLLAAFTRAQIHAEAARREEAAAHRELDIAVRRLVEAATGGHK